MSPAHSPSRPANRGFGSRRGEEKTESSPLIEAARMGDVFGVKTHMDRWKRRADLSGMYALHMAALANNVDIVKCLVEAEADLRNRDGATPLMLALASKAFSSAIVLITYSSFDTDEQGYNPLDYSVRSGSLECVQCVVLYFKPSQEQIYPALEDARRLGHSDIERYLQNVIYNVVSIDCGECWKLLCKYGTVVARADKLQEQLHILEEARADIQPAEGHDTSSPNHAGAPQSQHQAASSKRGSSSKRSDPGCSSSVTFSDVVTVMGTETGHSSQANKELKALEQELLDMKARVNQLSVDLDLKQRENDDLTGQLHAANDALKAKKKAKSKGKDADTDADSETQQVSKFEYDKVEAEKQELERAVETANATIYQQQAKLNELEEALAQQQKFLMERDPNADTATPQFDADDYKDAKKKAAKKKKDPKEAKDIADRDKQITFLQGQLTESERRCTRLAHELDEAKSKQISSPHLIPYMQLEKSYKLVQEDLIKQEAKTQDLQITINALKEEIAKKNVLLSQARGVIATQKEHFAVTERTTDRSKLYGREAAQKTGKNTTPQLHSRGTIDEHNDGNVRGSSTFEGSLTGPGRRFSQPARPKPPAQPTRAKKQRELPPWRGLTDEPDVDLPDKQTAADNHLKTSKCDHSYDNMDPYDDDTPTFRQRSAENMTGSAVNNSPKVSPMYKTTSSPRQSSPLRISPTMLGDDRLRSPPQAERTMAKYSPTRSNIAQVEAYEEKTASSKAVVKYPPSRSFAGGRQTSPHLFSTETLMETSLDSGQNPYASDTISILAEPSALTSSPPRAPLPIAGRRPTGSYNHGPMGQPPLNTSGLATTIVAATEQSFETSASPQQQPSMYDTSTRGSIFGRDRSPSPDRSNPIQTMINNARTAQYGGQSQYRMQEIIPTTVPPSSMPMAAYQPPNNSSGHLSKIPLPHYQQQPSQAYPSHQPHSFSFRVGNVLQGPGDDWGYAPYKSASGSYGGTNYAINQHHSHLPGPARR